MDSGFRRNDDLYADQFHSNCLHEVMPNAAGKERER